MKTGILAILLFGRGEFIEAYTNTPCAGTPRLVNIAYIKDFRKVYNDHIGIYTTDNHSYYICDNYIEFIKKLKRKK